MSVADELKQFITSDILFGRDDIVVAEDTDLFGQGLVDSLGLLRLVAHLEEHYRMRIADEDLVPENLGTIARLAAFVARHREERA